MSEVFINLTPHPVAVLEETCARYDERIRGYISDGDPVVKMIIPESPQESIPRCREVTSPWREICGVNTQVKSYGDVDPLPEMRPGTWFIVSSQAAQAGWKIGRYDLIIPDRLVRSADPASKSIVGCLGFSVAPELLGRASPWDRSVAE